MPTVAVKVRDNKVLQKLEKKFGAATHVQLLLSGQMSVEFVRTSKDNANRMASKIRSKDGVLSAVVHN